MHSSPRGPLDGEDLASVVERNEGMRFTMGNSAATVQRGARTGSNVAYLTVGPAELEIMFKFCLISRTTLMTVRQAFRLRCLFSAEVRGFFPCDGGGDSSEVAFSPFRIEVKGNAEEVRGVWLLSPGFFGALRPKTGIFSEKHARLNVWATR